MIEIHTKMLLDKVTGKDVKIISRIKIGHKIVAKYDETIKQINLDCLKPFVGTKVFIYDNNGKKYSHSAQIDSIDPGIDGTNEGYILNLGKVKNETEADVNA